MNKKEIPLGRRNQVTLPKEFIPEGAKFFLCEKRPDGAILLTPAITVPLNEAYLWTARLQKSKRRPLSR